MAGDMEYRTSCLLSFKDPHTFSRFIHANFIRNFFWLRSFLISYAILWTLLYFVATDSYNISNIFMMLIGNLTLSCAYYKVSVSGSPLIVRGLLLLVEHFTQVSLRSAVHYSTYLALFNLPIFVAGNFFRTIKLDSLLLFEWPKHLVVSFAHAFAHYFFNNGSSVKEWMIETMVVLISATIFGFVERAKKESWVLFDSFKKSSMLFMRFVDAVPFAAFLTEANGRICYQNSDALKISGSGGKGLRNFVEMVHSKHKNLIQDALKGVGKSQETDNIEVAIQCGKPDEPAKEPEDNAEPLTPANRKLKSEGTTIAAL